MTDEKFSELVNSASYQVFLFSSPVPVPLHFAVHTWFVVNLQGRVERWEFGKFRNSPHPNNTGVLRDFLPPTTGMNKFFWSSRPRFRSTLISRVEGGESSPVAGLARFISEKSEEYPLRHTYSYRGPNSNTYVQWVLRQNADVDLKLPFKAFGKDYPC